MRRALLAALLAGAVTLAAPGTAYAGEMTINVTDVRPGDLVEGFEDAGPVTGVDVGEVSTLITWGGQSTGLPLRNYADVTVLR